MGIQEVFRIAKDSADYFHKVDSTRLGKRDIGGLHNALHAFELPHDLGRRRSRKRNGSNFN